MRNVRSSQELTSRNPHCIRNTRYPATRVNPVFKSWVGSTQESAIWEEMFACKAIRSSERSAAASELEDMLADKERPPAVSCLEKCISNTDSLTSVSDSLYRISRNLRWNKGGKKSPGYYDFWVSHQGFGKVGLFAYKWWFVAHIHSIVALVSSWFALRVHLQCKSEH